MAPVSRDQHIGLFVAAIFSSSISIAGSAFIIRFIKSHYAQARLEQRRSAGRRTSRSSSAVSGLAPTYLRLVFVMSCFDIIYSINLMLQPIFVDVQSHSRYTQTIAVGNITTCTVLGAFQQLAVAGFTYYVMLSYYYLFTVRLGKSSDWVAKRAEPWMHFLAIGLHVVTSVAGVIIDCYSYLDLYVGCWTANYPKGCIYSDGPPCSILPGLLFSAIPFVVYISSLFVNNVLVYLHVRKIYRKAPTVRNSQSMLQSNNERPDRAIDNKQRQRIRQVGTQATLYVVAALLTYFPLAAINLIFPVFFGLYISAQSKIYGLMVLTNILMGLSGFWNAIIFFRPRYLTLRSKNIGRWQAVQRVLTVEEGSRDQSKRSNTGTFRDVTTTRGRDDTSRQLSARFRLHDGNFLPSTAGDTDDRDKQSAAASRISTTNQQDEAPIEVSSNAPSKANAQNDELCNGDDTSDGTTSILRSPGIMARDVGGRLPPQMEALEGSSDSLTIDGTPSIPHGPGAVARDVSELLPSPMETLEGSSDCLNVDA